MSSPPQPSHFELAEPPAAAMIESMRGIGYTLETALADIIDNSIAAGARNVWLKLHWNGGQSYVSVLDDGHGMNAESLRQAMRPGSRNPLETRRRDDLGRFGLGLKTASFSQCRSLTVASKCVSGDMHVRRWDLEHVSKTDAWQLLTSARDGSETLLTPLKPLPSGTLVLWELLDRIVGDSALHDQNAHGRFLQAIERVREHLAMVFHRFLEDPLHGPRIYLNDAGNGKSEAARIRPWDPFLSREAATQHLPEEPIDGNRALFQGYVLPHPDRLKDKEMLEKGGGPEGWTSQQGFYVYRNKRLLAWGTWLGLGGARRWKRDELHKLARIRLDIDNSLDQDWKIDIKKSTASPPAEIRPRLTALADDVRERAMKVLRSRGEQRGPRQNASNIVRVWSPVERTTGTVYRVERKHPLVADLLQRASALDLSIEPLLQLLELSVPVQRIWMDQTQRGEQALMPDASPPEDLLALARHYLNDYMKKYRDDLEGARQRLMQLEPFSAWPDAILKLNP